jgi:Cu/Ag efflux pump CusA
LDEHVQGVESAEIDVRLEMKDRPRETVLDELRQKVSLLPGTNVTIGQPISHRIDHMLSGTRANIAVKIFGDDLPTLRQLARQVQGQMSQVEGVVDLATEAQTDIPTLKVRIDPAAAARRTCVGNSRGPADGARRPCRGSDSSGADRLSVGRSLRPGRIDGARRDCHDADPNP